MAERRSLTTAIHSSVPGVNAETVRSFVKQSPFSEQSEQIAEAKESDSDRNADVVSNTVSEQPAKREGYPTKKGGRFRPVGLIPITVRLRPEIAGALKRASLERELEGEEIFTQQDIVEQALAPYLKRAGFLD